MISFSYMMNKYGLTEKEVNTLYREMEAFKKLIEIDDEKSGKTFNTIHLKFHNFEDYVKLIKLGVVNTKVKTVKDMVLSQKNVVPKGFVSSTIFEEFSMRDSICIDLDVFEEALQKKNYSENEQNAIKDSIYNNKKTKDILEVYGISYHKMSELRRNAIELLKNSKVDITNFLVEKLEREKLDDILNQYLIFEKQINGVEKSGVDVRKYLASKMEEANHPQKDYIDYLLTRAENSQQVVEQWKSSSMRRVLTENIKLDDMCIPRSIKEYLNEMGIENIFDVMCYLGKYEISFDYDFSKFQNLSESKKAVTDILIEWSGLAKQADTIREKLYSKLYKKIEDSKPKPKEKNVYIADNFNKPKGKTNDDEVEWQVSAVKKILNEIGIEEIFADIDHYERITIPLKKSNIESAGDLLNYNAFQLTEIKGIGDRRAKTIIECLEKYGINLNITSKYDRNAMLKKLYESEYIQSKVQIKRNNNEQRKSQMNDPIAETVKNILDQTDIKEIKLPTQIQNTIERSKIKTVEDLLNLSEREIRSLNGLGKKGVDILKNFMEQKGMKLGVVSVAERIEMYRNLYTSDLIQTKIQQMQFKEIKDRVTIEQAEKEKAERVKRQDRNVEGYKALIDYYFDKENIFDPNIKNIPIDEVEEMNKKSAADEIQHAVDGLTISELNRIIRNMVYVVKDQDKDKGKTEQ